MALESKDAGGGFDNFIPEWSGAQETIRKHREDVEWWFEGVNLEATSRFNLAARYVARQRVHAVAERLRSLRPADLRHRPGRYMYDDGTEGGKFYDGC